MRQIQYGMWCAITLSELPAVVEMQGGPKVDTRLLHYLAHALHLSAMHFLLLDEYHKHEVFLKAQI